MRRWLERDSSVLFRPRSTPSALEPIVTFIVIVDARQVLELDGLAIRSSLLMKRVLASDPCKLVAEVLDPDSMNAWPLSHPCLVHGSSRSSRIVIWQARTSTTDPACDFSVIDSSRANNTTLKKDNVADRQIGTNRGAVWLSYHLDQSVVPNRSCLRDATGLSRTSPTMRQRPTPHRYTTFRYQSLPGDERKEHYTTI